MKEEIKNYKKKQDQEETKKIFKALEEQKQRLNNIERINREQEDESDFWERIVFISMGVVIVFLSLLLLGFVITVNEKDIQNNEKACQTALGRTCNRYEVERYMRNGR